MFYHDFSSHLAYFAYDLSILHDLHILTDKIRRLRTFLVF